MLTETDKGVCWGLSVDADISVTRVHFVSASSLSESAIVLFVDKHLSSLPFRINFRQHVAFILRVWLLVGV